VGGAMPLTLAVLYALFLWWFSTGAIIWAVSQRGHRWTVALTAPLGVLALVVLGRSGGDVTVAGAFVGFTSAIILWGWLELAFLAGVITGPNRAPCPPGARGWRRFRAAWSAVSHHELALAAATLAILAIGHGHANQTGLWTFLVLFGARISAKLNVYLGVPNLSDDMLPAQVAYLRTYFARARMNMLFPVSATALTFAVGCWIERAYAAPAGSGAQTGFTLLAALTALALIEHWFMMLPVRDTALWAWMTPKRATADPAVPHPID
jgi:putative photosynthetic complex assembly protein 2